MKIAQISATFPPYMGGTGNVCYNYSLELEKLGHDVTVYTGSKSTNNNYNNHNPFKINNFHPIFQIGNAPFTPQLLSIEDFDIIHLHYPFFFGGEFIYLLKKLKNQKYVLTYHNNTKLPGFLGKMVDIHSKTISKKIIENAEKIIVPTSDFFYSTVQNSLGINGKNVIEVPNGVNLSAYKGSGKEIREKYHLKNSMILLFVGALDKAHYYKGLEYLMKSIKFLVNDYDDIKLMIVGGGNLKEFYTKLAKEYEIDEFTIFIGKISNFEELAKYYEASDIVIYPTLGKTFESFGMVIIEAMAAGKPVIASNVPGVRAVLDDKINGYLTEPKNVAELSSKIRLLLDNKVLRDTMGHNGRVKAQEKYAWPFIVKKLEKIYEDCVYNL